MEYRILGRTGLKVSELGLGGEWFNGLTAQESAAIVDTAQAKGINYIDIFMPQAPTRSNLGFALEGRREQFIIQGHLCTVFEDGQYTRTRDIEKTKRSFEDLLERLHTDYIDIGMIHYVERGGLPDRLRRTCSGLRKGIETNRRNPPHRHELSQPSYCLEGRKEWSCGCADVQHQPRL